MNEKELKPCPFCGADGVMYSTQANRDPEKRYRVECGVCGVHRQWRERFEDAVTDWNNRHGERRAVTAERHRIADRMTFVLQNKGGILPFETAINIVKGEP